MENKIKELREKLNTDLPEPVRKSVLKKIKELQENQIINK